jgi:hypothetical protein
MSLAGQLLSQQLCLGAFSASINPFQGNKQIFFLFHIKIGQKYG